MKISLLIALALAGAALQSASAVTIYQQNFDSFTTGTVSPDGWWFYKGPANTTATLTAQPTGVGGSQALEMNLDASGEVGTDWYFYAGVGRSDIAGVGSLLSLQSSDVTLSLDIAMVGATSPTAVTLNINQYSGSTKVWQASFTPTLTTDGTFTHIDLNLAQGTQTGTWDPTLSLGLNSLAFNNGGFPLAAGDRVILDNVQLTAVPEPTTAALAGLGILAMVFRRRR
jgi:hypothetical protein